MTLDQATKELIKNNAELTKKLPELESLEEEYYATFYRYLLDSPMSNAAQREAEARQKVLVSHETMYRAYKNAKLDVRILLNQKEMLIEVSRNLRTLMQK